ncbi:AsmA family protein [Fretibacter rubidus]|uniref:AsmA family protein n=1 Tax=Fretibacter rubidus TaxID=570162 RepID=UPI00352A44F4
MRKIIIGVAVVILLLVAGLIALPSLIPSSVYKDNIEATLTRELARPVTVSGDVSLSVFPVIKAKAGRVDIGNPDGFKSVNFASMDGLDARIKLLPLLSKTVEISAFTLKNPEINLQKRSDGTVNWAFGDTEQADETTDTGPFKRDGRYSDIDPKIGRFALENGTVTYVDDTTQTTIDLQEVNMAFAVPSLSKPVSIDGSLILNGNPLSIDATLSTPRGFLNGDTADIKANIKAPFATLDADGTFLPGEAIAAAVAIDGEISDIPALIKLLPEGTLPNAAYATLADTVTLSGDYRYDGTTLSATNADISVDGKTLTARYKGDAIVSDTPVLNGSVSADIRDMATLAKVLDQQIDGIEVLRTAKLDANFASEGDGFRATNIKASAQGPDVTANFTGSSAYNDTLSLDGGFTADVKTIASVVSALKLDVPQAAALNSAKAQGTVKVNGKTIAVTLSNADVSGDNITANYVGTIGMIGDTVTAKGEFNANSPNVATLVQSAKMDIPQASVIGDLSAKGIVDYNGTQTALTGLDILTSGEMINGRYNGSATIGDTIALTGVFDASATQISQIAQRINQDIPYATALGTVKAKGRVSGAGEDIAVDDLVATLSGGQLNGEFTGRLSANTSGNYDITGQMTAAIPSVRTLAQTTGTALPASTDAGAIYEAFNVSGVVSGTPAAITFNQAKIALDALSGTGDFTVDMAGTKPHLKGKLALNGLDLRPYMAAYAAQNPTGAIQPWANDPIDLTMLRTVDATLNVTTPNIVTDRMELGTADMTATLQNGKLTTTLPQINLYGGLGGMTATVDASGAIPMVSLDADLSKLTANSFLGAVAGFTKATGEAGTKISIRGSGNSQAAIMKSLSGSGDFKLLNGSLSGIDVGQFMTGLETALTQRSLPAGIGPTQSTKFSDLMGLFTIENGVAKIGDFTLAGNGIAAEGAGQIDLGAQTIDFSLRPRATGDSATGLAAFGIPIQLKGGFGSVSAGLDTDLLGRIVAERAQDKARDALTGAIKDKVGGSTGDVIGGIIGGALGGNQTSTQDGTQSTPTTPTTREDAIGNALGGLLGVKKADDASKDTTSENTDTSKEDETKKDPAKKEPTIEDALGSLFGKKKKDD